MAKQFNPMKTVNNPMDFTDVEFPCVASIKFDGVYMLNLLSQALGRSLKKVKNEYITDLLSREVFSGFCGEVCHGDMSQDEELRLNRQDLCRTTTSHTGAIKKIDWPFVWVLFDFIGDGSEEYCKKPYWERMVDMAKIVEAEGTPMAVHEFCGFVYYQYNIGGVTVIFPEAKEVFDAETLESLYEASCEAGYEGIVVRSVNGIYKWGRCTVKSQEMVRFKPSDDSEIIITKFEPMYQNNNEAKINELGRTERSSHKENKVQLEAVGAIHGVDINTGALVKIGAGKMTHEEREGVWKHRDEYLGGLAKYRFMATGIKDKPRHPRFISWRLVEDVEISDDVLNIAETQGVTPKNIIYHHTE